MAQAKCSFHSQGVSIHRSITITIPHTRNARFIIQRQKNIQLRFYLLMPKLYNARHASMLQVSLFHGLYSCTIVHYISGQLQWTSSYSQEHEHSTPEIGKRITRNIQIALKITRITASNNTHTPHCNIHFSSNKNILITLATYLLTLSCQLIYCWYIHWYMTYNWL